MAPLWTPDAIIISSSHHLIISSSSSHVWQVAPLWTPDAAATVCMVCHEGFSVMRRRHHCRHCGKVLCAGCSESRVTIAGLYDDKPVRVP